MTTIGRVGSLGDNDLRIKPLSRAFGIELFDMEAFTKFALGWVG